MQAGDELPIIEQIGQKIDAIDPINFCKYIKILDATSNQIVSYELWPHLVYVIRAIYKWKLVIILKPKQVGISWTLAVVALQWCDKTATNVIEISKGEDQAIDLLAKSAFIESQLPKYLQHEKDHEGAYLLHFKNKHSRIHTLPSTQSAGLGETGSLVICDENEFHPYATENWGHLKPTIDAGAHCVVVSTADPTTIDSHFKILYRGARKGKGIYPIPGVNLMVNEGEVPGDNGFFPIFLGCDVRPGRTKEWFEEIKKTYYLDWQFRADYPKTEEEALSPITGRTVFDTNILQKLQQEALKEEEIRQGVIHIFHRPKIGVQYIAGVDMAEGRGGDYSVLWIEGRDGLSRELVAVIHSNHILPDTFSYMSYELLKEYFSPKVIGGADAFGTRFLEDLVVHGYDRGKIYSSDKKREKLGYIESAKTR
ncbi:MAG: hypothetical protein MUP81_02685, partial [Dehalococcoidia bacterium]|nr:hypothetical protein [Dehalococcoidia bacterium]